MTDKDRGELVVDVPLLDSKYEACVCSMVEASCCEVHYGPPSISSSVIFGHIISERERDHSRIINCIITIIQ